MIPVKLRLRNFMCYRDNVPDIQFDAFRVACLSGDNGNGKSALLDAITWCLWGQARARTDDELIHQGCSEMEVEFDFRLGDDLYRVLRKRTKGRTERAAGQTVLELHVADGDSSFLSITGDHVRETERQIVDLLRMEYQTFINSAYLVQGRADEFTVKPPAERKKVLADILDLSYYDKLERGAREAARQRETEHRELLGRTADVERELERRDEYRAELEQIQTTLAGLDEEVRDGDARLSKLREGAHLLELKREQEKELSERLTHAREEIAELESQVAAHRVKLEEASRLLASSEQVRREFLRLRELRALDEELTARLARSSTLRQQRAEIQHQIERQASALRADMAGLQASIAAHESKAAAAPALRQELDRVRAALATLDRAELGLGALRTEAQAAEAEAEGLRAENRVLRVEMERLREKLGWLEEGSENCPLCESHLAETELRRLRESFEGEGRARAATFRANEARIRKHEERARALAQQLQGREAALLRDRSAHERRAAVLEERLEVSALAESTTVEPRQRLAAVRQRLQEQSFALEERALLNSTDQELERLAYDPERHRAVREQLRELASYEDRHCRLQQAENAESYEKAALLRAEGGLRYWREREDSELASLRAVQMELARLDAVASDLNDARTALEALVDKQSHLRQMLGAARQKLEYCAYLERSKSELQSSLARAAEERAIYEELAMAFGKKGVQAMIIESALPELEHEANTLLERMTDGRMTVSVETQRDSRKGETIETLDIKISDEFGTRSYETFSGGEAFRVNFALRVALSKLLARRAGTRLQTLILDEGFGTQDALGREKLVEAITSIQDEFEKILVITHIQELKDLFNTRLEITKTDEGSMVTVH
ncbi:MAG: SMC family ATPase [Chloroflexota bacterium]|nr:MAG: SMC family ATPase [Chloroflexota bacterium]